MGYALFASILMRKLREKAKHGIIFTSLTFYSSILHNFFLELFNLKMDSSTNLSNQTS